MSAIELGGRKFAPIKNSTFEHDVWMMNRIRSAGLDSLELLPGETASQFADRVLWRAMESQSVFEVLAGLLCPTDIPAHKWTPSVAEETAVLFKGLTSDADKTVLRAQLSELLLFFIRNGISSLWITPKFSAVTVDQSVNGGV